jgi:hypothetical protein
MRVSDRFPVTSWDERGQAHLPDPELIYIEFQILIERLSRDISERVRSAQG